MDAALAKLRDPLLWTDLFQIVKTAAAAVIAWWLAARVFGLPQPFLAPWAALLTVHATVYRTVARGAQQVGATVLGVLLAFAAGTTLGSGAASLGCVLFVALLAGHFRPLRAESTTAAATALVVLLTGYSDDGGLLVSRLLDTFTGIGVGLLVNVAVRPPLRDRSAARHVDRIDDRLGALLCEMADGLRDGDEDTDGWVERTRDLDHEIDDAWGVLREARESGRLNLRRQASPRLRVTEELAELLVRLEQAVAETRSMARTIARTGGPAESWDPSFRDSWLGLLAALGDSVTNADATAVARVRADVEDAGEELFAAGRGDRARPAHGALLVNLRNIAEAMDAVAEAQPVHV